MIDAAAFRAFDPGNLIPGLARDKWQTPFGYDFAWLGGCYECLSDDAYGETDGVDPYFGKATGDRQLAILDLHATTDTYDAVSKEWDTAWSETAAANARKVAEALALPDLFELNADDCAAAMATAFPLGRTIRKFETVVGYSFIAEMKGEFIVDVRLMELAGWSEPLVTGLTIYDASSVKANCVDPDTPSEEAVQMLAEPDLYFDAFLRL